MRKSVESRRRAVAAGCLLALALMLLLAACGSSGTPAPTATPTLQPQLSISTGSTAQDILNQFQSSERECMRESLGDGAYDEFLKTSFATISSPAQIDAFFSCIGPESATRFYLADVATGVGGRLSNETFVCMSGVLAGYDVLGVLSGTTQPDITMFLGTLLCFNDEEAVKLGVTSFPAPTERGEVSLEQMRCVADEVGIEATVGVLLAAPGSVALPPEVRSVVEGCGVRLLAAGRGTGFSLTGEQFQCLTAALDPSTLIELQSGARVPTAGELAIIQACEVQLGGP